MTFAGLSRWLGSLAASSVGLVACGHSADRGPAERHAALGPRVAAQIGPNVIDVDSVRAVARDANVSLEVARDRLVRDALYAAGAEDAVGGREIVSAERAVHARALLEELQRSVSETPPTDAEIDELARERWKQYERPSSVVTAHVVVLVKKQDEDRPARALAERLHQALRDVTQADRFVTEARAVATGGLEIAAEKLPAVAADGRVTADDSPPDRPPMVVEYARAANAIAAPGDKSPVVKSPFGYHVILLVERVPERHVQLEQRRVELSGEVLARRAKRELTRLLESLRRQSPPDIDRASADLTSRVQVRR